MDVEASSIKSVFCHPVGIASYWPVTLPLLPRHWTKHTVVMHLLSFLCTQKHTHNKEHLPCDFLALHVSLFTSSGHCASSGSSDTGHDTNLLAYFLHDKKQQQERHKGIHNIYGVIGFYHTAHLSIFLVHIVCVIGAFIDRFSVIDSE